MGGPWWHPGESGVWGSPPLGYSRGRSKGPKQSKKGRNSENGQKRKRTENKKPKKYFDYTDKICQKTRNIKDFGVFHVLPIYQSNLGVKKEQKRPKKRENRTKIDTKEQQLTGLDGPSTVAVYNREGNIRKIRQLGRKQEIRAFILNREAKKRPRGRGQESKVSKINKSDKKTPKTLYRTGSDPRVPREHPHGG